MTIFTGTSGDDSILGTSSADDFHLEDGGNDTASGGGGVDVFYMGGAFNAGDQLDGGAGADFLMLDGDYSAGVTIGATTLVNIERIIVAAGHDYVLGGLSDANIGRSMIVDGSALGAGDTLKFGALAATQALQIIGGLGADTLTGGAGQDTIIGGGGHDKLNGAGGNDQIVLGGQNEQVFGGDGDDRIIDNLANVFRVGDKIDGGAGHDILELQGDYGFSQPLVFNDNTIRNIETLILDQHAFNVVMADGNVAAGQTLEVDAGYGLNFDGRAETDGHFNINTGFNGSGVIHGGQSSDTIRGGDHGGTYYGEGGDDFLYGGGYRDVLYGGAGNDLLSGGRGNDTLDGGLGADTLDGGATPDTFVFETAQDSTASATDLIKSLGNLEVIDLHLIDADVNTSGDQAFHLVASFTGQAGELTMQFDSVRHQTVLEGDVDGDGQADLVVDISGDHRDFTNFVL